MTMLRLRRDAVWREADGEVLALDGASTNYVSANASAVVLWKMLVGGATRSQLAARLVEEFEIDADRAERDVDRFVGELASSGLLDA